MRNFFQRLFAKTAPPGNRPVRSKTLRNPQAAVPVALFDLEPLPLPDVAEGNSDADWAQWEDSVMFQDSQIPPLSRPPLPVHAKAHDDHDLDPFAFIHKNSH